MQYSLEHLLPMLILGVRYYKDKPIVMSKSTPIVYGMRGKLKTAVAAYD